jgi:hypothetical protein
MELRTKPFKLTVSRAAKFFGVVDKGTLDGQPRSEKFWDRELAVGNAAKSF